MPVSPFYPTLQQCRAQFHHPSSSAIGWIHLAYVTAIRRLESCCLRLQYETKYCPYYLGLLNSTFYCASRQRFKHPILAH